MQNAKETYSKKAQMEIQDVEIKKCLGKIKNKILVMSGKGGVGKSCISVSIAVGLANLGYKVGLMDVDLHGPSIPQMLGIPGMHDKSISQVPGIAGKSISYSNNMIIPARYNENLSVVSIECMLESKESAVIWRGPLKLGVIRQFISEVQWGELDYLIIDSPPGTGDEPLTVAQTIPDAEAVIVTTPQDVSLRDVRKSINFCRQVNMNIRGLIENMSGFVCPECGAKIDLFKVGGGEKTAKEMNVPFMGKIPIIPDVVQSCDIGVPAINSSNAFKESFNLILESITATGEPLEPQKDLSTQNINKDETLLTIAIPLVEGKVAMHFGHCQEFLLIDVNEREKEIIKKKSVTPPGHEPGVLPKWLHEQGANVIISGGMGSRAQSLFEENNIKVITGANSEEPEKIVMDYMKGILVSGENICDH